MGIFSFGRTKNGTRAKKMKEEGRGGRKETGFLFFFSPPHPHSFTCPIFCTVFDSCSLFQLLRNHMEMLAMQAKLIRKL